MAVICGNAAGEKDSRTEALKMLEKQLQLLSEQSKLVSDPEQLARLSDSMSQIVNVIFNVLL